MSAPPFRDRLMTAAFKNDYSTVRLCLRMFPTLYSAHNTAGQSPLVEYQLHGGIDRRMMAELTPPFEPQNVGDAWVVPPWHGANEAWVQAKW
jgi:hypothetical protein